MVPRQICVIGCVFGLCMSANYATAQFGGCSGFSMQPRNLCTVVSAAINCTASLALAYLMFQLFNSGGGY